MDLRFVYLEFRTKVHLSRHVHFFSYQHIFFLPLGSRAAQRCGCMFCQTKKTVQSISSSLVQTHGIFLLVQYWSKSEATVILFLKIYEMRDGETVSPRRILK